MLSVFHIVSVNWGSCKILLLWLMVQSLTLTCIFLLKVVLVAQLVCWTMQFIGHGVFEASLCHAISLDTMYFVITPIDLQTLSSLQKRAPALLDNLVQAFLMAPFFVLLEVNFCVAVVFWLPCCLRLIDNKITSRQSCLLQILHTFGGYEPYPGFHDKVSKMIEKARKEWEDKNSKKSSWDVRDWTAPISRLACSTWTCWIGWTYTMDDYWIQMLFML